MDIVIAQRLFKGIATTRTRTPLLRSLIIAAFSLLVLASGNEATGAEARLFPLHGSKHQNKSGVRLHWKGDNGRVAVYAGPDSSSLTKLADVEGDSSYVMEGVQPDHTYYWRLILHSGTAEAETTTVWRFEVSDIRLDVQKFIASADPASYDDETDSRYETLPRTVDLSRSAFVVMDLWDSDLPVALTVIHMIEIARRHGIPVFFCTHEGVLHHGIQVEPWEIAQDTPIDEILKSRGITTLFYLGFDSGTCLTISRPNSIVPLTKRNPGAFDIIVLRDCIWSQSYPFHFWNVQSIEATWQSSTFADLATALDETGTPEPWNYWVYDWPYTINTDFAKGIKASTTALLVVNAWASHENDGWSARIRSVTDDKISRLLYMARYSGYKILHVLDGRVPAPSCAPLPSEPVFGNQDSLWAYLSARGVTTLIVAGNFDASAGSVFPLIDGWSLGFSGGGKIRSGFWGKTVFVDDCISVFETPASLSTESLKHAFLMRQTTAPGTWTMGTVHSVSTLGVFHANTNAAPVIADTAIATAVDGGQYTYRIVATDPETIPFGDSIRYQLLRSPVWLAVDSVSGTLTGYVPIGVTMTVPVELQVTDNNGASSRRTFSLRVAHVNHGPALAAVDPVVVREDDLMSFVLDASDPDTVLGQRLRFSLEMHGGWLSVDSVSGAVTVRPGADNVGTRTILCTVADDSGATATVPCVITVVHTNHAPVCETAPSVAAVEDRPFTTKVQAADVDTRLFRDRIRYAITSVETWLSIDTATGTLSGVPSVRDLADTLFSVIAIDDSGAADTLSLTIPIRHVNHAPVFAPLPPVAAAEDTSYAISLAASDRDTLVGDRIHYRMILGPDWMKIDTLSGYAIGTPRAGDVGTGTLTVLALDDSGTSAMLQLSYAVRHTNHAPVPSAPAFRLAVEDSLYTSQIAATDADAARFGDTLRFTAVLKPAWLTVDPLTGALSGTPRAGQLADSTLAVVVSDGRGGTSALTTSIAVVHTNHAPVFATVPEKNTGAIEDVPFVMQCAANDGDTRYFGDSLTYSLTVRPHWLSIDRHTGLVTGTPAEDDHDTTFTVVVTDGAASTTMAVPLPVEPVNDPPVIAGRLNISLMEDSCAALDLLPFAHDPDDARDALQWRITSVVASADYHFSAPPPDGSPAMHAEEDSLLIYLDTASAQLYVRARKNFTGSRLPIVFTVRDPGGLSIIDTLFVDVIPVNDPPVLARCSDIAVAEDDSLLLSNTLLASLVTDPDDADSTLTWLCSGSKNVRPACTADGIRMLLTADWSGTDSITVVVLDHAGLRDSTRVAVHVRPVNDAPVLARVPDLIIRGDSTVTFSLAAYVTDVDDSTASLRAEIAPLGPADPAAAIEHAVAGGKTAPSGAVHFAIDSLMNATISISGRFQCVGMPVVMKVHDPQGGIGLDTLLLTVAPNALPPVISAITDTMAVPGKLYTAHAHVHLADADASPLQYFLVGPSWLCIDSTGTLAGIPPQASDDTVMVIVVDGRGASDSLRFRIITRGVAPQDVPADYVLFQNYPNPFNPSTTLRFGLPEPSRVSAAVFNILGQRVATIFSSDLQEGYHTVQWAPVNLASGAYILVLEAHGLVSAGRDSRLIKKVTLVR